MKAGKVWLVGAGPGDPELITVKATRAIANADVILHDDLVHPALLQYAAAHARIIAVGKRGGCKSTPQAFIERMMIAQACRGLRVVRLKGGDPFVFGRGGEEIAALRAAGIEVEVISGVSAGMAAAASLRAPLTHRDVCPGVIFVTGHSHDAAYAPDWSALVRTGMTLVVYMGVHHCASIQSALIEAGMARTTPAAVIENASLPQERRIVTNLDRLSHDLAASGLGSPSVMVIGDVVRYADLIPVTQEAATGTAGPTAY